MTKISYYQIIVLRLFSLYKCLGISTSPTLTYAQNDLLTSAYLTGLVWDLHASSVGQAVYPGSQLLLLANAPRLKKAATHSVINISLGFYSVLYQFCSEHPHSFFFF